jgi:hypothetical protein
MDSRPFGIVVRDLLLQRGYVTGIGNPNWAAFALKLPGIHYETLRKSATGERPPNEKLMRQIAKALTVEPAAFLEFRLLEAQKDFDPREVGSDQANANLAAWAEARPTPRRRGPRGSRSASV